MSTFSTYKKIFLLGFIIVVLIAVPFSVYIAQQRQQTKSKASASTTLSFEPASPTIKVGDTLTLDIMLDPGTGTSANQVSFVKLSISYDAAKFTTVSDSLAPNSNSPNTLTSILEDSVYTDGKATISLSIGADPTRAVIIKTKIAILKLKAISATTPTSSNITFDSANTQVLSIASLDKTSENVLISSTIPAIVTITSATTDITPTPSSIPTATPTPTPTPLPDSASLPTSTPTPTNLGTGSAVLTPTPVVTQSLPTQIALPPTGPGAKILGIGAIGVIFTLIGGALLLL